MSTIAITSSETKRTSLSTMGQALKTSTTLMNIGLIAVGAFWGAKPEQHVNDLSWIAAIGVAGLSSQIVSQFGRKLRSESFVKQCRDMTTRLAITSLIAATTTQVALSKLMGHDLDWKTVPVCIAAMTFGTFSGHSTEFEINLKRARKRAPKVEQLEKELEIRELGNAATKIIAGKNTQKKLH